MVSNIENSFRFSMDGLGFEMTKKWLDEANFVDAGLEHGTPL
jgi:hypothetical protein